MWKVKSSTHMDPGCLPACLRGLQQPQHTAHFQRNQRWKYMLWVFFFFIADSCSEISCVLKVVSFFFMTYDQDLFKEETKSRMQILKSVSFWFHEVKQELFFSSDQTWFSLKKKICSQFHLITVSFVEKSLQRVCQWMSNCYFTTFSPSAIFLLLLLPDMVSYFHNFWVGNYNVVDTTHTLDKTRV